MAYTRYLAVGDARKNLSKLAADGVWTQKLPTLQDVASVFASKSTYFNHNQIFAEVHKFPLVEKWLLHDKDAPSDSVLWGYKKPTYEKLKKLVEFKEKKEKRKNKKGKKRQDSFSPEPSAERMSDKKGKGKQRQDNSSPEPSAEWMGDRKGKEKKGGNGGKKGSSSKSHRL
jgi:hypothetical protein